MTGRPAGGGATLEILVSLLLLLLLFTLGMGTLRMQLRSAGWVVEAAEAQEALRLSRWIVGSEVRAGVPRRDWHLEVEETVRVRAFRGVALPCGEADADGGVPVRFRGLRAPDPEKDSVLVLGPDGRWRATSLERVGRAAPAECPEGYEGSDARWTLSDEGDWVVGRLFEAGTYHLADGALRYRRGAEGRQPLVAQRFGPTSRFGTDGSRLMVRIEVAPRGPVPEGARWIRTWGVHAPER